LWYPRFSTSLNNRHSTIHLLNDLGHCAYHQQWSSCLFLPVLVALQLHCEQDT
jgi:hypothetical protein